MKKWTVFIWIFLFSAAGFAADEVADAPLCSLNSAHYNQPVTFAEPIGLEWWSVSPEQVANAPCKNHRPPMDSEMLSYLSPSSLTKKSELILGISFKDEDPELLQLFRDLHRFDVSMANAKPLALKSVCNKVVCSSQSIYGARVGIQIAYMLKRYGFNGSHLRTMNASLWRADELDDILTALSDYPLELYPLDYNRKLVHYTRGSRMKVPEGESVANSTMEVYDMWNDITQAERQQSLLHELGHVVARKDNVDDSAEWYNVAGWQARKRSEKGRDILDFVLVDPSKAVSKYGQTNPHEDFAESVVAYRFGGAKFKSQHLEKYNFLKERVFDGKEYLTPQSCVTSKSRTELRKETNNIAYVGAVDKAKKNANNLDSKFVGQAQDMCLETLAKVMMGETGSTENCTSRALQRLQLEKYGKRKNLDGSLLSDEQLNAISFKGDTEKDFNTRVRTKFSIEAAKVLPSDVRTAASCDAWAKDAHSKFSSSTLVQDLARNRKYYFYQDGRYERLTAFFGRVCQSVRQSAGRLDLGILQNLP